MQLHHLGISAEEAHLFQRLANAVLYSDASLRPASDVLSRSTMERSTLWAQGISGDLPIVLARIDDADDVEMIRQLLRAHEYWRMKQLSADVVIINEKAHFLRAGSARLARSAGARQPVAALAGHERRQRQDLPAARQTCYRRRRAPSLQAVARVVLLSRRGTLVRTDHAIAASGTCRASARAAGARQQDIPDAPVPQQALQFFNGLGGFARTAAGIRTVLSEGLAHAGALGQRDRESIVRISGFGIGLGFHLVAEQPRKSNHALVQRSCHRSCRGSHLHAR